MVALPPERMKRNKVASTSNIPILISWCPTFQLMQGGYPRRNKMEDHTSATLKLAGVKSKMGLWYLSLRLVKLKISGDQAVVRIRLLGAFASVVQATTSAPAPSRTPTARTSTRQTAEDVEEDAIDEELRRRS
jgi:hypothetical protein